MLKCYRDWKDDTYTGGVPLWDTHSGISDYWWQCLRLQVFKGASLSALSTYMEMWPVNQSLWRYEMLVCKQQNLLENTSKFQNNFQFQNMFEFLWSSKCL